MADKKNLIINADDFGQSDGVNRGIIEAHEHGVVTSASLMVRWPAADEAAAYGRANPELSLGLHLDLGEWIYRDDAWVSLYEVVPLNDAKAVADEISRQVAAFERLTGRQPTHLDSHQHVHFEEPVRSLVLDVGEKLEVPVRNCTPAIRYCGDFYGQTVDGSPLPDLISVDGLIRILAELSTGATELGTHPGLGNDLNTMYCSERTVEASVLCDSRVRAAISQLGIKLCSFTSIVDSRLSNAA